MASPYSNTLEDGDDGDSLLSSKWRPTSAPALGFDFNPVSLRICTLDAAVFLRLHARPQQLTAIYNYLPSFMGPQEAANGYTLAIQRLSEVANKNVACYAHLHHARALSRFPSF